MLKSWKTYLWFKFTNMKFGRLLRRSAKEGNFDGGIVAFGRFGEYIELEEQVCSAEELRQMVLKKDCEGISSLIKDAMQLASHCPIVDFKKRGIVRRRWAFWCDLGYPGAPEGDGTWRNLKGRGCPA